MIKYFYDLLVYLTSNYSLMPDSFKARFSEERLVNARQITFDLYDAQTNDFDDYE